MNKEYWGLTATIVGSLFAFYIMTKQEMAVIREQTSAQINATHAQISVMNQHHREDIKHSEDKWERLFDKFLPHFTKSTTEDKLPSLSSVEKGKQ